MVRRQQLPAISLCRSGGYSISLLTLRLGWRQALVEADLFSWGTVWHESAGTPAPVEQFAARRISALSCGLQHGALVAGNPRSVYP